MEISSPVLYVSAPTSPTMHFYSAPTSPLQMGWNNNELFGDETYEGSKVEDASFEDTSFEFRYGLKGLDFETSPSFEYLLGGGQEEKKMQKHHDGEAMAFADELFRNGKVLPLKLPPRFHSAHGISYHKSTSSSPIRSPALVVRSPFSRRSTWNDGFDPFAVALDKVKQEETRWKNRQRRTRSLSPLRTTTPQSPEKSPQMELIRNPGGGPLMHYKELPFGRKVMPMKLGHEGTIKPGSKVKMAEKNEANGGSEKGVQGFLQRYASCGREKDEVKVKEQIFQELWKGSYLGRLSFKLRENSDGKKKTRKIEPKMDRTQYQKMLASCWSFHRVSSSSSDKCM